MSTAQHGILDELHHMLSGTLSAISKTLLTDKGTLIYDPNDKGLTK